MYYNVEYRFLLVCESDTAFKTGNNTCIFGDHDNSQFNALCHLCSRMSSVVDVFMSLS